MTNNEIIKALEEYVKENEFEYFHSNTMGEYPLIRKALNLINRLQSQNKDLAETVHNLTLEKDALFDRVEELKAEVEILKEFIVETRRCDKEIKSEAVKEFAEMLKHEIINDTAYACDSTQHSGYYDYQIKIGDIPEYIDNLVKEIVGDDNA